ncbi:hypothetical protein C1H46_028425 [Malus baccata]|uniref:Uncharacterized protein n=1 Tax=Malus baccata TaxID=106549 RepID=A0A540LI69_MALBA|nr:hypothetical protein C1H46_028425 [Malus baccata]
MSSLSPMPTLLHSRHDTTLRASIQMEICHRHRPQVEEMERDYIEKCPEHLVTLKKLDTGIDSMENSTIPRSPNKELYEGINVIRQVARSVEYYKECCSESDEDEYFYGMPEDERMVNEWKRN